MAVPDFFRAPIREIVNALADGRTAELEADKRAGRLSARELDNAIREYGRTLVHLPDEAFDLVDAGQIGSSPSEWWMIVPLWTAEEGRSDLSLELEAEVNDGGISLAISDLHVL